MFCVLNGYTLKVPTDDAFDLMLAVAAWWAHTTTVAPCATPSGRSRQPSTIGEA
jgi:prophage maintenance system killer protein